MEEEGEHTCTEQEGDTYMQTANGNAHRVSGKGRDWDFALRQRKRKEHGAQSSEQRTGTEGCMELLQ